MAWRSEVISPCRGLDVVCPVTMSEVSDKLLPKPENPKESDRLVHVESRLLGDFHRL